MKRIIEIPNKVVEAIQNGKDYRYDIHTAIAQSIPYNPSGDLISREVLKETLRSYPQTDDMRTTELIGFFEKLIDNAPAIDISGNEYFPYRSAYFNGVADGRATAIPKGKWINHRNDYGHNIADCSLCGKTMQWHDEDEDGIPRYCWYCGASMKGGAE